MKARARIAVAVCCLIAWGMPATVRAAGDRHAIVITGASGGADYQLKYELWRMAITTTLREKLGYPDDHIVVLSEDAAGPRKATRENVRAVVADLRRHVAKDDLVTIVLFGHGDADGEEAKFDLVGPDLSADDWADLLITLPARVTFIDTTSGSYPFLRKLASPGRVVITATNSAAQEFETVFPDYFVKAFADPAADRDKNGKVSMWEAFAYASAGVRQAYQQKGELATERALLDDTGRGTGREADMPGADGTIAQVTYLQPDASVDSADAQHAPLLKRRAELEAELELLKAKRPNISEEEYQTTLERLLLELARVDAQLRSKS